MASIHRQPNKPNWFCAFYDPEGFRRFRSTGTENAKVAQSVCVQIDRAATLARQGKLSNEKALRLVREATAAIAETHGQVVANRAHETIKASVQEFIKSAGGELSSYTVRSWLDSWLAGRTDASRATVIEYRRILNLFLKFLGTRADRALTTLQSRQIEEFKPYLGTRVSPSTVNKALKVLKAAFNQAVKSRQLEFSPAEHVVPIQTDAAGRRPFTSDELTKLLAVADAEWRTMILLGYYTGLRLSDCANLTWAQIDLVGGKVEIVPQKTKNTSNVKLVLPLAAPLLSHLAERAGDDPTAPLCAGLHGHTASWLSTQFYEVMVKAGLVAERDHQSKGRGRDGKREGSRISFHSLRYCTASALQASGASAAIAMDIVGHETEAVHRHYAGKVSLETKREALSKLPDITSLPA